MTEASNGFKETEIGPVPVDWDVVRIDNLCRLGRDNVDPQELPEMPYVGLEHIDSGEPQLRRWGNSSQVKSSKKRFAPGDVLYGKLCPYLDKAVLAEFEGICSTDILVLKANRDLTTPEFLVHTLHTQPFLSYAISTTSGTNLPRTRWTSLRNFNLALPPLPEQHRIAHVLSTIQRAIAAQDDLIAAAREVKRSLMQRLFTYGPGAEPAPTKETEIGEIPKHWEVVRLGDMAEFKNGINFKSDQKGRGILTVDVLNMYAGGIAVQMDNLYRVDVDLKEHYLLQPNDILLVRSSLKQEGVGWPTLFLGYTEPVAFCGFLIRARLTSNAVLPEFLVNYLRLPSVRQLLVSKSGKVAITNINQGNLKSLSICLPPLQEQEEIAKALRTADCKIEAEEQRKAALYELFKSMLHQLMTGQIRLSAGADFHCMPF